MQQSLQKKIFINLNIFKHLKIQKKSGFNQLICRYNYQLYVNQSEQRPLQFVIEYHPEPLISLERCQSCSYLQSPCGFMELFKDLFESSLLLQWLYQQLSDQLNTFPIIQQNQVLRITFFNLGCKDPQYDLYQIHRSFSRQKYC